MQTKIKTALLEAHVFKAGRQHLEKEGFVEMFPPRIVRASGAFITRYPDPMWDHGKEIEVEKFFNMLTDPEHPGLVLSADLILPIAGEAVGSAARVDDPRTLVDRLSRSKMFARLTALGGGMDDFAWYLERANEKMVPHAGCGFGMSRILRWIAGTDDVKDAVTFPANQHHII